MWVYLLDFFLVFYDYTMHRSFLSRGFKTIVFHRKIKTLIPHMLKRFVIKSHQLKKQHYRHINIHYTRLLIRFPLNKCQYRIVVAHLFCHNIWPFLWLFENIGLQLNLPINARRYFDSRTVRGEGNSLYFATGNSSRTRGHFNDYEVFQWNSRTYFIGNDRLWNTAVFFLLLKLKSNVYEIGALNNKQLYCTYLNKCRHTDKLMCMVAIRRVGSSHIAALSRITLLV